MKAATITGAHLRQQGLFQSTPPVKAATNNYVFTDIIENISIHAAREGGDLYGSR